MHVLKSSYKNNFNSYTLLLYSGLFSLHVNLALYTCKQFCPILNSPGHNWDKERYKFADDNEGIRGENKRGEHFPEYSILLKYMYMLQTQEL